jgi:outer membrane usher protein
MLGWSVARDNTLQRYRITSPLGQSSFFLKQDSVVEVLVNGHTVQTLQMSAGPHQVKDFPLISGANDVVLRITDTAGRVEYINATFMYDPTLLKAGESEFNYAAGVPSMPDPREPIYRYGDGPAVSAFHRWGVTDHLTLGFDAQGEERTQLAGAEAVIGLPVGTFNFDAGFSHNQTLGLGSAQRLEYHYYAPTEGPFAAGVLSLAAQHLDAYYTPPTPFTTVSTNGSLWNVQARYSQRLSDNFSAGIGYSVRWGDRLSRIGDANLLFGYNHGRLAADLSLDHYDGSFNKSTWAVFLSIRITLGRNQSLFGSYDSGSHTSRGEWQYLPANDFEAVGGTLGVQTTPHEADLYGNILYTGRRAELGFSQNILSSGEKVANLRWGAALVYADGLFAVSRPVLDSFAIVRSSDALRQEGGVGVDAQAGRFRGQEDFFGPAVLPQLYSYYPKRVVVEPRAGDADFDPKEGDFTLQPTYRSGTAVRVGHEAIINALVRLKWPDGLPAALQVLIVTAPGGATSETVTDRDGNAYLSDLKPGKYTAMIADSLETRFGFTIPTTKERQVSLGEIKLPAKP